jgi:type I restriction enzyme R subunit
MSERHPEYNHQSFRFNEEYLSQIPAIQLLINLGYRYISPEQAVKERNGKLSSVLLDNILRNQLKAINKINYKGSEYLFSEENIQSAIQKLKSVKYDGLLKTNETIYDLLTLGVALEQTIEGDSKSFNLKYIDWTNPDRNCFHVTAEYSVERSRSSETVRPDIVLFVNGIPLSVIECKSPKTPVEQAVSQMIRNQNDEYIPGLFIFTQIVLGINKNEATYATTGSAVKFWSIWKEDHKSELDIIVNTPLSESDKTTLFNGVFKQAKEFFENLESGGKRRITEQDRALFSLCRPERLLELAFKFTVFDFGIKKIARYQQYLVIKSTLSRIKTWIQMGKGKAG